MLSTFWLLFLNPAVQLIPPLLSLGQHLLIENNPRWPPREDGKDKDIANSL